MAKNKIKTKILVIDDDPKISWILTEGLSSDYDFVSARDGIEGIQMVSTEHPDLILLDIKMPGMSGLEVLEKLNKLEDRPAVIMISGHSDTTYVVDSIKLGAAEFVNKPFDVKEVEIHINGVLERTRLKSEVKELKQQLDFRQTYGNFIGDSTAMRKVKAVVEQVADSELSVLIRGASGTGKEIVARSLHELSSRQDKPFIKVNCAAIPRDLLEAELFGYDKGAFTGAHKDKQGRFELADKGTMFLDEIGDMPLELQAKLLQVLEQHEFMRVGGVTSVHVETRIICATNRDLEQAIANREFRDDLFYRLNEITIPLPPLKDRLEDIPLLVEYFLKKYSDQYEREQATVSPEVMNQLVHFHWPGNIRQLENMLKQVVVRGDESIVGELIRTAGAVPAAATAMPTPMLVGAGGPDNSDDGYSLKARLGKTIAYEESRLISEVLGKTNWNRRKAAELLQISYRSLLYKIKDYDLNAVK